MTYGDLLGWGLAAVLWLVIVFGTIALTYAAVVGVLLIWSGRPGREYRDLADDFRVLLALADGAQHYVVDDLQPASGVRTGRIHLALARLERSGDVASGWATGPEPRRRWYRLTPAGLKRATPQVLPE